MERYFYVVLQLDITVLAVETNHVKGGTEACDDFMESQGYTAHKKIRYTNAQAGLWVSDTIYVKKRYLEKIW